MSDNKRVDDTHTLGLPCVDPDCWQCETYRTARTEKPRPITIEAARAAMETDRAERVQACREEIAVVLAKHRCDLAAEVILRAGQVIPQVVIMGKD